MFAGIEPDVGEVPRLSLIQSGRLMTRLAPSEPAGTGASGTPSASTATDPTRSYAESHRSTLAIRGATYEEASLKIPASPNDGASTALLAKLRRHATVASLVPEHVD